MEARLSWSAIGDICDCLLKARRLAAVDYVRTEDQTELNELVELAEDVLVTLRGIEIIAEEAV
jgi:hypothetical protein